MAAEPSVLEEEKRHQLMVDNLMREVREWVAHKGGVTGELHLRKRCRQDGVWYIEMTIDPSSSSVMPEHVYLREIDLLLLLRKS